MPKAHNTAAIGNYVVKGGVTLASIRYRSLIGYKYQLMDDCTHSVGLVPIKEVPPQVARFVSLSSDGVLTVHKFYDWDGPRGPTIDTPDFLRGSLVHDALYQIMRAGVLDYRVHRKRADELLRDTCREDGMCAFRAWYVYQGVHLFAEKAARPQGERKMKVKWAPRTPAGS